MVNILFGVYNENEDNIILNHLILMAKFYIYKCKLNSTNPSLKVFIAKTKTVYQIERQIPTKHDKLLKHYEKWKKILASIQWRKILQVFLLLSPFFLNCNDCVRNVFFSFLCKTVIFIVLVKVIFFCIITVIVIVILSCTWKIKILNYKIKKANAFLKRYVLTVP